MSSQLEVMVRDRREGKTTETILWLLKAPLDREGRPRRVLLCAYEDRVRYILGMYPALKNFIFTPHSWDSGRGRGRDIEVAVDDAEEFIYQAVRGQHVIKRITISGVSV